MYLIQITRIDTIRIMQVLQKELTVSCSIGKVDDSLGQYTFAEASRSKIYRSFQRFDFFKPLQVLASSTKDGSRLKKKNK